MYVCMYICIYIGDYIVVIYMYDDLALIMIRNLINSAKKFLIVPTLCCIHEWL